VHRTGKLAAICVDCLENVSFSTTPNLIGLHGLLTRIVLLLVVVVKAAVVVMVTVAVVVHVLLLLLKTKV
jgi:hypothetical protein